MQHVSTRFPSRAIADLVCAKLQEIVRGAKCYVSLEDNLSENDIKRGVGKWAIVFEVPKDTITCLISSRMYSAVDFALQLALADELQKSDPNNCLLQIWHLNQNNRPNCVKFDFTDSYSL